MNSTIMFLLLVTMIPLFSFIMFMPYWTRKTESFGVTIPIKIYHSQSLKTMRKNYMLLMGLMSILALSIFWWLGNFYSNDERIISIVFGITITFYIVCSFIIYLKFHLMMKKMKLTHQWGKEKLQTVVVDTKFHNKTLTLSNMWFSFSFIVAILTMVFTLVVYEKIPSRIPMQYNFSGVVTNWVEKSYRSVMLLPIMQVYLTGIFMFINTIIAKSKQQISAENPDESMKKNIIFRRRWSAFIIISGIVLTLMFSLLQLNFIYNFNDQWIILVPVILTLGIIFYSIVLSISTGQGGSRIKTDVVTNGEVIDRDDDHYWKLGRFYFNKNDPALFLEKRFGIGWTINWARPITWLLLSGLIILAAGIPIILTL